MPMSAPRPRRESRIGTRLSLRSLLGQAVVGSAVFTAAPAWADSGHDLHGTGSGGGWVATAAAASVVAMGVVAVVGLLRPLIGTPARAVTVVVSVAAAVGAVGGLIVVDRPLVALALAAVTLAVPLGLRHARRSFAAGLALSTALALVAATTSTSTGRPIPGSPLLREVSLGNEHQPILVVPHRPGWNLVHTSDRPLSVGADRARLRSTSRLPGATGTWASVWLPPGPGRLWVRDAERTTEIAIDTGRGPAAAPEIRTDGPECASAALGALVAGRSAPLASCPAEQLDAADAGALRSAVNFLAGRGTRDVYVVGDASPRSRAAMEVIRDASRRAGLAVTATPGPRRPLVIVAGWSAADATLRKVASGGLRAQGAYLSPWLLSAPLLTIPAAQVLPLRFSPRDPAPLRYAAELRESFHGETPTTVGFQAWQENDAQRGTLPARLYSASLVTFIPPRPGDPHVHGGNGWLPGGTITVASGPLSDR
jgi:hypothetical protein